MGYKVKTISKACMDCGKAKVMQKRLKREAENKAMERETKLTIDIASNMHLAKKKALGATSFG